MSAPHPPQCALTIVLALALLLTGAHSRGADSASAQFPAVDRARADRTGNGAVAAPAPYAASTLNFAPSPAATHSGPSDPATSSSAAATPTPGASSAAAPGSADPGEDIRDIRGPKYLFPAWLIAALVVAVVLLSLAAYGGWRWLRGRRQRARVLLPFELASQRLEELRPLMRPERARDFSIAVSDIVRLYIEQRFDVTATHRTTEEFLHDLLESSKPSLVRHRGLLSRFLQQCDLVKFGGMSLSQQDIESLQQSARAFVLETAAPDPAAGPADAATATASANARATATATAEVTATAEATATTTAADA